MEVRKEKSFHSQSIPLSLFEQKVERKGGRAGMAGCYENGKQRESFTVSYSCRHSCEKIRNTEGIVE